MSIFNLLIVGDIEFMFNILKCQVYIIFLKKFQTIDELNQVKKNIFLIMLVLSLNYVYKIIICLLLSSEKD